MKAAVLVLLCLTPTVLAAAGKTGAVGEKCAKGDACQSGICNNGTCISRQAACTLAAARPVSNCVGNVTAPFNKITCNDFTTNVATTLQLAQGLGSVINSTECYSNGAASCVVLQDSASLVNYGAQCPPTAGAASGAGAAAARAAAALVVATLAAVAMI